MDFFSWPFLVGYGFLALIALSLFNWFTGLRRVVSANEVHIIQGRMGTTSYGKDMKNGNVYYEWPTWIPFLGVQKVVLPVSNFDLILEDYNAYDVDRLPFTVDVMAFFRISDSNVAAQRVADFKQLYEQLEGIIKSAVRSVMATHKLEEILQSRSKFGDDFSKDVNSQLANWGVESVKNIEIMDVKDASESEVIHNIMQKQKSVIQMESRKAVAINNKLAQESEIESKREIDLYKQQADQQVGLRTVETQQTIAMAEEKRKQTVADQQKSTTEKTLEVAKVTRIKNAEIEKEAQVILASQQNEVRVRNADADKTILTVKAEAEKAQTVLAAEAKLESARHNAAANLELAKADAQGTEAKGTAAATSEKLMLLAPVEAQITLANKIGGDEKYQSYLIAVRRIESEQAIGIEQAKAIGMADIKVIANTGNAPEGIKSVSELFSSKGGQQLGAMVEGLANTDTGKAVLNRLGIQ